jgi:hypothetical protein
LQAVTDCELLVFSRKDWDEILNSIVGWDKIAERMYRKCLIETIEKRSPLVSEDATTRYLLFLKKFPALANRVPLLISLLTWELHNNHLVDREISHTKRFYQW